MYKIVTIFFGFACKSDFLPRAEMISQWMQNQKMKQFLWVAFFSSHMATKNYTISNEEKYPLHCI